MQERITARQFYRLQPAFEPALDSIDKAAHESGLALALIELVKVRVSQLNGCAYCVAMHATEARAQGARQERLDLLPVWREAACFDARERAALAWAEALTLVAQDGVPDAVYREARAQFSEAELASLTAAIVVINSWNRIAVAFRFMS